MTSQIKPTHLISTNIMGVKRQLEDFPKQKEIGKIIKWYK